MTHQIGGLTHTARRVGISRNRSTTLAPRMKHVGEAHGSTEPPPRRPMSWRAPKLAFAFHTMDIHPYCMVGQPRSTSLGHPQESGLRIIQAMDRTMCGLRLLIWAQPTTRLGVRCTIQMSVLSFLMQAAIDYNPLLTKSRSASRSQPQRHPGNISYG